MKPNIRKYLLPHCQKSFTPGLGIEIQEIDDWMNEIRKDFRFNRKDYVFTIINCNATGRMLLFCPVKAKEWLEDEQNLRMVQWELELESEILFDDVENKMYIEVSVGKWPSKKRKWIVLNKENHPALKQ